MELEADWDLYAIVRGSLCSTTVTSTDPEPTLLSNELSGDLGSSCDSLYDSNTLDQLFQFQNIKDNDAQEALNDHPIYKLNGPFFHPSSASPVVVQQQNLSDGSSCDPQDQNTTTIQRFKKRRKDQLKKVHHVLAEAPISSEDTWSWRKYGQKPIKGSPYPRSYYKCSSSKGCPARKQVERNRTNPNMFIVTYTAEHNHPAPTHCNSLTGITRYQKKVISVGVLNVSRTNVSTKTQEEQLSSLSEEQGDMKQRNGEAEWTAMMMGLQRDVDGGECGPSMEMEDDFFDGLDGMIDNIGDEYWSHAMHTN